jgi:hypothetical protein
MSVRKRRIKLTRGLKFTKNWRNKFIKLSKIIDNFQVMINLIFRARF